MKKLIFLPLAALVLALAACGGGASGGGSIGGGSSAVFQYALANQFSAYTQVGHIINDDNPNSSSNVGCGVNANLKDQATTEAVVASLGGTILTSTPTKWCGIASGQTSCIIQADRIFVIDTRTAQYTSVEINMPGLVADRMTVVSFNSQNLPAKIESRSRDSTRTNSSNCPSAVTQSTTAIDGEWSGYRVMYDANTKSATSIMVSISCENQVCTFSDAPSPTISLGQPLNGTWTTSANSTKYASAVISGDRQLLSVFVCSAPLIEAQTLDSCGFYTFKR